MLSRTALRRTQLPALIARRGFHSTRARLSGGYHYPEGPLSSLPFNPRKKYFGIYYWSTMGIFASVTILWLLLTKRSVLLQPSLHDRW